MSRARWWRATARRRLPVVALIAALLAPVASATAATPPAVTLSAPASDAAALTFTTSQPVFNTALILRNTSSAEVKLTIAVTGSFRDRGEDCAAPACALAWSLRPPGAAARAIAPEKPEAVAIAPGGFVAIGYGGAIGAIDTYRSEISITGSGTPITRAIRIDRQTQSLGADAIRFDPARFEVAPLVGDAALAFGVRNTGQAPASVTVGARLMTADGAAAGADAYHAIAAPVAPNCGPATTAAATSPPAPTVVPAAGKADCRIDLPSLGPGRYRAAIDLGGDGIVALQANGDFSLRYPGWIAFLVILAGIGFGGRVGGWQKDGRRRALQSLAAAQLAEQLKALPTANRPVSVGAIEKLLAELKAMRERLESDRTADFEARLAVLSRRPARFQRLVELEAQAAKLNNPSALVADKMQAAAAAVAGSASDDDIDAALAKLEAAIGAPVPAANTGGPGVVDNVKVPSGWGAAQLAAWIWQYDRTITITLILIAGLIGVNTLWSGNPAWGGLPDFLVAFLTGAGLGLGGTLSLQQLAAPKPLGTIPTLT